MALRFARGGHSGRRSRRVRRDLVRASAIAVTSGPTAHPASAPVSVVAKRSASAHQQVPQVVTQVIGKGRMDGHRWSVVLEFHRTLPEDYTLPTLPNETTTPGTSLL